MVFAEYITLQKALQPSRWDETASRDRNPHLKMRAIFIGSSGTKKGANPIGASKTRTTLAYNGLRNRHPSAVGAA
jgi:hypothetical protein